MFRLIYKYHSCNNGANDPSTVPQIPVKSGDKMYGDTVPKYARAMLTYPTANSNGTNGARRTPAL